MKRGKLWVVLPSGPKNYRIEEIKYYHPYSLRLFDNYWKAWAVYCKCLGMDQWETWDLRYLTPDERGN